VVAAKRACEREVLCLDDDAFSAPLPELFLSSPEFFSVPADDKRRFLLLFLLLVFSRHLIISTLRPAVLYDIRGNRLCVSHFNRNGPLWGLKLKRSAETILADLI
jgi:hypothetical protein